VEIPNPGKLVRVYGWPISFFPKMENTREGQNPLLARILAALCAVPRGMRHSMDLVIGSPYAGGRVLPKEQTLSMARAGGFAQELVNRGTPLGSMSIGLKRDDPTEIMVWFYVHFLIKKVSWVVDPGPEKLGAGTSPESDLRIYQADGSGT
jgi:hypothetical protein